MRSSAQTELYDFNDIKRMALRWEWAIEDMDYLSRKVALKMLYQLILSWMDGHGNAARGTQENFEMVLSIFARDVCLWLMEYPKVENYCPSLVGLGLTSPDLVEQALLQD